RDALGIRAAKYERVARMVAVDLGLLAHDEANRTRIRWRLCDRPARCDTQSHHESVHLMRRVGHVVRVVLWSSNALLRIHRDVMRQMAGEVSVEDPIAGAIREKA